MLKPGWRSKRSVRATLAFFTLLLGMSILYFAAGREWKPSNSLDESAKHLVSFLKHIFISNDSLPEKRWKFPKIKLDIGQRSQDQLMYTRHLLMNDPYGTDRLSSEFPWLRAGVRLGEKNKVLRAKLRLKGRLEDHWVDKERMSYNVKLLGEHRFLGLKEFSLQHPRTRRYSFEWLLHKIYKELGLIARDYNFAMVSINGKGYKLFLVEESIGTAFFEKNGMRPGVGFKLNSRYGWLNFPHQYNKPHRKDRFAMKALVPMDKGAVFKSSHLKQQWEHISILMESFKARNIKASDLFDVSKFALALAVADLLGTNHALYDDNLRLFYNPLTLKVEPVLGDADRAEQITHIKARHRIVGERPPFVAELTDVLLSDKEIYEAYLRTLRKLLNENIIDRLIEKYQGEWLQLDKELLALDSQAVLHSETWLKHWETNKNIVSKSLLPFRGAVTAHLKFQENKSFIAVQNNGDFPIELVKLSSAVERKSIALQKMLVQPTQRNQESFVKLIDLGQKLNASFIKDVDLVYRFLGSDSLLRVPLYTWSRISEEQILKPKIYTSNLKKFPFVKLRANGKYVWEPGRWVLQKPLIVGAKEALHIGPGVHIHMRDQGRIIVFGNFSMLGTTAQPVKVRGDARNAFIAVVGSPSRVRIENVLFDQLSRMDLGIEGYTAGLSIYGTELEMSNTEIKNVKAEDALNVYKSKVQLKNIKIVNAYSDALDGDFIQGRINGLKIINSGNDALDFSGSKVAVTDVQIDKVGDKGVSVGEGSLLELSNVDIQKAKFAIANKDSSRLKAQNIHISDSSFAIAHFVKKSEFEEPNTTISRLKMEGVQQEYLIEKDLEIMSNGKRITGEQKNVDKIVYPQ